MNAYKLCIGAIFYSLGSRATNQEKNIIEKILVSEQSFESTQIILNRLLLLKKLDRYG